MLFLPTPLPGVLFIQLERYTDERGFLARTWCREGFAKRGLVAELAQCSISHNNKAGTVRGLHFQARPLEETKLVRCSAGAIYDVVVDLRRDASTFGRWHAVKLTAEHGEMLYIPEGFAHGFQTLTDGAQVFYGISTPFVSDLARGVRWDDPTIGINWPLPCSVISDRDRALPPLEEVNY